MPRDLRRPPVHPPEAPAPSEPPPPPPNVSATAAPRTAGAIIGRFFFTVGRTCWVRTCAVLLFLKSPSTPLPILPMNLAAPLRNPPAAGLYLYCCSIPSLLIF